MADLFAAQVAGVSPHTGMGVRRYPAASDLLLFTTPPGTDIAVYVELSRVDRVVEEQMEKPRVETLFDYRDCLPWVWHLGWTDDQLRQVPVHRQQTFEEPFLSLPVGGPVRQEARRGLYVFKSEVPPEMWGTLLAQVAGWGGPSGYEQPGMLGHDKELEDSSDNY